MYLDLSQEDICRRFCAARMPHAVELTKLAARLNQITEVGTSDTVATSRLFDDLHAQLELVFDIVHRPREISEAERSLHDSNSSESDYQQLYLGGTFLLTSGEEIELTTMNSLAMISVVVASLSKEARTALDDELLKFAKIFEGIPARFYDKVI